MTGKLPLSISIVCKNNADTIGRTLGSVRELASEIVAVDSGSTDATIAMLTSAGARVISSAWMGHVKTKQLALEACSQPWVLCIDSDESVEPELARVIFEELSKSDGALDGYAVNRRTYYRGEPLRHAWQPEWRVRLVRRDAARWGGLDPHDVLTLLPGRSAGRLGGMGPGQGVLRHDSFASFAEHLRTQWTHASTMARSLHRSGVRGSYLKLLTSPPGAFLKQLVLKRGFLDGYAGWLAAASTACAALIKHSVLIELNHADHKAEGRNSE